MNKIAKTAFCFLGIVYCTCLSAANVTDTMSQKKNAVFFELGGNGYAYSLNYEREFLVKENCSFSGKLGCAFYPQFHNATYLPLSVQMYFGKRRSRFELGIGYTPIFRWSKIKEEGTIFNYDKLKYTNHGPPGYIKGHDEPFAQFFYINVGWHQDLRNNFFLKVQASPWITENHNGYHIAPWAKVAFGKKF
jgi:hypothetical protein